jgi:hypothetical protein
MTPCKTVLSPGPTKASWFQRFVQWVAEGEVSRTESRAYLRVKTSFEGKISGPSGKGSFRGIDLHHAGVGVKTWRPLKPGTTVFLQLRTFQQMGFAIVKHCTWTGLGGFHVGLEFRSPLMRSDAGRWQVKQVQDAAGSAEEWDALMGRM